MVGLAVVGVAEGAPVEVLTGLPVGEQTLAWAPTWAAAYLASALDLQLSGLPGHAGGTTGGGGSGPWCSAWALTWAPASAAYAGHVEGGGATFA